MIKLTSQVVCANCVHFRFRDRLCLVQDRYRKAADSCPNFRPMPYRTDIGVVSNYREV